MDLILCRQTLFTGSFSPINDHTWEIPDSSLNSPKSPFSQNLEFLLFTAREARKIIFKKSAAEVLINIDQALRYCVPQILSHLSEKSKFSLAMTTKTEIMKKFLQLLNQPSHFEGGESSTEFHNWWWEGDFHSSVGKLDTQLLIIPIRDYVACCIEKHHIHCEIEEVFVDTLVHMVYYLIEILIQGGISLQMKNKAHLV